MVAPLQGTETLRDRYVWTRERDKKREKRRRKRGHDEEEGKERATKEVFYHV